MPIEDDIEKRHLTKDVLTGRTMHDGHVLVDLARLVEEVRFLRAAMNRIDRATLREQW